MSPPLFRLPNEVFDHIFSLILPHEVLNAALSCKSVLEVAKPHLTKYKDLSQANKVVYLGYTADVDGLISPLAYLETIVRNPSLAYYPRAIQLLEYDNEEYWDEDDERDFEKSFEGRELEKEIVRRQQVSFADLIDGTFTLALSVSSWSNWVLIIQVRMPIPLHPSNHICQ